MKPNGLGNVPLVVLCRSKHHTSCSVQICTQILDGVDSMKYSDQLLLALKTICSNDVITEHTVGLCEVILEHLKNVNFRISTEFLPLHAICGAKFHSESAGVKASKYEHDISSVCLSFTSCVSL